MSSVDKMDRKAEDSTNYSSDPNYENSTTNEGENSSTDEAEDLLPKDVDCLSTNEAEDFNLDEFKDSDDTPARQQPMRVLNCYEMFIPLVEKHKGVFKNVSGQPKYKCHL